MSSLLDGLKDKSINKADRSILPQDVYNKLLHSKRTVFFAGAGFSKAWDSNYPLGFTLFSITNLSKLRKEYNFFKVATSLGIKVPESSSPEFEKKCYEYFSEIKFHLDIYKRYPSLMPSYLNLTIIIALEDEIRLFIKNRFIELVGIEELELSVDKDSKHSFIPFFERLIKKNCLPSIITTNYDFIFEKILNNLSVSITLNRGVIDKAKFVKKEWHEQKLDLLKLNGGFEIYRSPSGSFHADYSNTCESPNIILPSQDQNYDDKYFKTVFVKSAEKLREADILVFIGYSLPKEDHTIRFLLKNFVDSHSKDKEIILIDRDLESAQKVQITALSLFPSIADQEGIYALNGSFNDLTSVS